MDHSPAFLDLVNETRRNVREVGIPEILAQLRNEPDVHLIDVREDNEWDLGHAAGAEHMGKGVIERDIEARIPDKQTTLILYCGGGFRSILAASAIQKMGYTNVSSMVGGWRGWQESGSPIEGGNG